MKVRALYLWISLSALLLALAAFFYLGTFTRLYADDFCMAGDALRLGLPAMLAKWYSTWTGRYMFILGTGLFGLGGGKFSSVAGILFGVLWLFGLGWAYLPLFRRSGWPYPRLLASVAACLTLLVLLESIPNFFQSFFWENGMVNYTLPLIGFTSTGGLLLRVWLGGLKPLPASLAVFLLAFISGGFTESFSAMQVTLFILLLLVLFLGRDKTARARLLLPLSLALLGGLASMLIVILAPGNAVRLESVGGQAVHPGLLRIVTFSLRNMTHILGKYVLVTPVWALVSILPPFLAGWLMAGPGSRPAGGWTISNLWKEPWMKGVVLAGITVIALVTAACAPVVFALNAYPDDRTIIVPQFVTVLAAIGISSMLGIGLRKGALLPDPAEKASLAWLLQGAMVVILLAAAGVSVRRTVQMVPEFQASTRSWDQRDAAIREALASGQDVLTVNGGNAYFGLPNLSDDPANWVNACTAEYYGVRQIIGR